MAGDREQDGRETTLYVEASIVAKFILAEASSGPCDGALSYTRRKERGG